MYDWLYNQPVYNPFFSQFPYYQTSEPLMRSPSTTNITQLMMNHMAISNEILSIVRQNNEMLRSMLGTSEETYFQHPAVQQP